MKKKVIIRGPLLTRSGYGEHARFVLRALLSQEDKYDIYVSPVNWGKTGWIFEDTKERRYIDSMTQKTAIYHEECKRNNVPVQYDISFQVTIPNEWEKLASINIGVTAGIETTKISLEWIQKSELMDKIIVVSEHAKTSFLETAYDVINQSTGQSIKDYRCHTNIDVVHYPTKSFKKIDLGLDLKTKFNFLCVAQWGPRKNMETLMNSFVNEFSDNEEVGLIIKSNIVKNNILDRRALADGIENILSQYPDRKCKVYLLHGDMTDEEIHSLYTHPDIKAYVTTTHGEGFGLPIFEAAYSGMPVIAPDWSGHVDFLYKPTKIKNKTKNKAHFAKIDYTLKPVQKSSVWNGVIVADSMWCYVDENSTRNKMRDVYKDYGRFKKQATQLKKWVLSNFNEKDLHKKFNDCVDSMFIADEVTYMNSLQNQTNEPEYMVL